MLGKTWSIQHFFFFFFGKNTTDPKQGHRVPLLFKKIDKQSTSQYTELHLKIKVSEQNNMKTLPHSQLPTPYYNQFNRAHKILHHFIMAFIQNPDAITISHPLLVLDLYLQQLLQYHLQQIFPIIHSVWRKHSQYKHQTN